MGSFLPVKLSFSSFKENEFKAVSSTVLFLVGSYSMLITTIAEHLLIMH